MPTNPINDIPPPPVGPLDVGISDCLTGSEVRYDGGHKRSALPRESFEGLFRYHGICPEVGIGLPVPREPIRLVGSIEAPRARGIETETLDVTDALDAYGATVSGQIEGFDGYIFMKGSPSCGLHRVKVYARAGVPPTNKGRGIFAAGVARRFPNLPLEESGRLHDAALRENFVTRVFTHAHWRSLTATPLTAARLIAFHSTYKYLVMAHSVPGYRALGRLLSDLSGDVAAIGAQYFEGLMAALAKPATRGGHANALSHLQGYVKQELPGNARRELAELIESYRAGRVPLLAPLTLLKHHLGNQDVRYALSQLYLQPHPEHAGLRRDL